MADTVSSQVLTDTTGVKYAVKLTNFSDGTGETLVKKVDASETTFMTEDGNRKISKIFWSINTANPKSAVEIIWEGATNATAVLLNGQGFWDLRADGNEITNNATTPTGDVLLSTKNFANGDNYTILVVFR
jgi:outer membrane protease